MKARGGALVSDRCSFITYGINTDLVNLGDAASKCPSVPGLRRSSRRAAMPRVRIGDVCADHPLGASARAAHPLARRAVVVARGNLPGVDRRREAALENPAAAQRRGGGCCGARSARLVHAEPVAAPPVVACSFGREAGPQVCAPASAVSTGYTGCRSYIHGVLAGMMRVRELLRRRPWRENMHGKLISIKLVEDRHVTTGTSCIDRFSDGTRLPEECCL